MKLTTRKTLNLCRRAKNLENLIPMKPKIEAFDGKEFCRGDSRFSPLSEIDVLRFRVLQAVIEAKI